MDHGIQLLLKYGLSMKNIMKIESVYKDQIEMILIMEKANMTPEEAGALFFNKESNLELYKYFLTDLLYK